MEALCKLKVWLRENLNNLVVEKSDDEIDSDLMTILLNIKDILKNPAFWFTFFGSIATELTENCDKTFEVTANWLHYATAVLMEKKKGQLLAIDHLKKYLSFLINVVKIFENMVEYFNENSENKNVNSGLNIKDLQLSNDLPLRVTSSISDENFVITISSSSSEIELVQFVMPRFKQKFSVQDYSDLIQKKLSIYRRNVTFAVNLAIALVEKSADVVKLLDNGDIINFLLDNQRCYTGDTNAQNTFIFSVVALFRGFFEIRKCVPNWKKLPWVSFNRMVKQLMDTRKEKNSKDDSTLNAAPNTFAIFQANRARYPQKDLYDRLLLLLNCLVEAVSREFEAFSCPVFPRSTAFSVPSPAQVNVNDTTNSPLSVGYFAYGTNDDNHQLYQWKCCFPLCPPSGIEYYYAEVFLFTKGSIKIGFHLDKKVITSLASKDEKTTSIVLSEATVFFCPKTQLVFVNGQKIETDMVEQTNDGSTIIGVLLKTGISDDSIDSSHFSESEKTPASKLNSGHTVPLSPYRAAISFFVNGAQVKVKNAEKSKIDEILKEPTSETNVKKKKFEESFYGNLVNIKKDSKVSSAAFMIGLAGYQAVNLNRSVESWYFYNNFEKNLTENNACAEFPVLWEHQEVEIIETCRLISFKEGEKVYKTVFEEKFVSETASYKMMKSLGEGSFGDVFLCQQKLNESNRTCDVAVKIIDILNVMDLKSLKRELTFFTVIENKNNIPDLFIKRLDVFTFLQVYTCIVLEKMEISLKSYIKKHSFTLPQAKSIFHQLLKVLAVLSEIKYVHGDLKTGNVMIKRMPNENDPEVSIKVIDFGTARCIENGYCGKNIVKFPGVEPFDLNDNESDRCYTPGYAAPEWLLDLNGKDKTYDLWSVGVTVAETIVKKQLYINNVPDYFSQLEAIWHFCDTPNQNFYETIPEKNKVFFIQELLSSGATQTSNWRLKTKLEWDNQPNIPEIDKKNHKEKSSRWTVKKVKDIEPHQTPSNHICLKEQLKKLLSQIFVIETAKRITLNDLLNSSVFKD